MEQSKLVKVTDPLEPYAAGYRSELDRRGYSAWTTESYLYAFARVSRWLGERYLTAADLDAERVERFLSELPVQHAKVKRRTPRGTTSLLGYLRGLGVVPPPFAPHTATDSLLDEFAQFLRNERGLAERTICWYRWAAGLFLSTSLRNGMGVGTLSAQQINEFVLAEAGCRGAGSLNNLVTALRALLRFCYLRGYVPTALAAATPSAANWHDRGPSRGLAAGWVERLLTTCDQRSSGGSRDFAILTVLARLGLRAGEVAALRLDDVHWRIGEIAVNGKGNRTDRLPLPVDVGQAIAGYCRRGRRQGECRALFLQTRAPYTGLSPSAVSCVVVRACRRAGLPEARAHRLRHSAAVALRGAGAPLFEIGQLLRHGHIATTAGYARDDQAALAQVARRWPGRPA